MFHEKLKNLMIELNMTQSDISEKTGVGKSSISQYISGKFEPTEKRKISIAEALNLPSNYFDENVELIQQVGESIRIQKLLPENVAKMMGMDKGTLRKGLQQGVFPWGYAIQTSEKRWVYFINAKKFSEVEGVPYQKAVL